MLQPRVLPKIIQQANTDGVKSTLLLHSNGSLLSSYGSTKEMDKLIAAIVSNVWNSYSKAGRNAFKNQEAINQANHHHHHSTRNFGDDAYGGDEEDDMMDDYHEDNEYHDDDDDDHNGDDEDYENRNDSNKIIEKLQCLLLDCEAGRLAITGVSSKVILCLCAEKKVEFGMLRAKAMTVREYLAEPFALVESND